MGVDFYSCCLCSEAFDDCGRYAYCSECDNFFCRYCMDKYDMFKRDGELNNCPVCNSAVILDRDLLQFALEFLNRELKISRAALEEAYRANKRAKK